jgi:hypothetical protein
LAKTGYLPTQVGVASSAELEVQAQTGSFANYGAQFTRDPTTLVAEAAGPLRYYSLGDLPKYAGKSAFARSKGLLFRSSQGSPSR